MSDSERPSCNVCGSEAVAAFLVTGFLKGGVVPRFVIKRPVFEENEKTSIIFRCGSCPAILSNKVREISIDKAIVFSVMLE